VVFSTWSMWSVYNNQWVKLVSHETEKWVVSPAGPKTKTAYAGQGKEQFTRQTIVSQVSALIIGG
jgi:hypothetical protein